MNDTSEPTNRSLQKDLSIIIPFYNEAESVGPVIDEVINLYPDSELIAIDDGSSDETMERLLQFPQLRVLSFPKNQGQSAAILAGLQQATNPLCGLLDGDGQNDPRDLVRLAEHLITTGCDVVCGFRANRQDTWSRRYASKIANKIRRGLVHDGVRDTGCSVKVFRREAVPLLIPFNGMHRFLPAFFQSAGLRIEEIAVNHRARKNGASKYTNWDRALRGIYDLIGVRWFLKRRVSPLKVELKKENTSES